MRAMGHALLKSRSSPLRFVAIDAFDLREGITELHLQEKLLFAGAAPLLAGLIQRNSSLVLLNLHRNGLGPTGAHALADGITYSHSLKRLNMSQNYIRQDGLESLSRGLARNGSITALNLASNQVCGVDEEGLGRHTTVGIQALVKAMRQNILRELDLSENRLEVGGAKVLAIALRDCTMLKKISLAKNNLTFFGLNSTGVEEIVLFATAGASSKKNASPTSPADIRHVDLTDNHLNLRALTWQAAQPPGNEDTSIIFEAKRCKCHYCLETDHIHQSRPLRSKGKVRRPSTMAASVAEALSSRLSTTAVTARAHRDNMEAAQKLLGAMMPPKLSTSSSGAKASDTPNRRTSFAW